jgi:hypothetical protein
MKPFIKYIPEWEKYSQAFIGYNFYNRKKPPENERDNPYVYWPNNIIGITFWRLLIIFQYINLKNTSNNGVRSHDWSKGIVPIKYTRSFEIKFCILDKKDEK